MEIFEEYLVLFGVVTKSIEELELLKKRLIEAQQKAEALYIERGA